MRGNKYKILKKLGKGSHGTVVLAEDQETLQMVAIKRIRQQFCSYEESLSSRELQILRELHHPNIIALLDAFYEDGRLYLVLEYLESNLCDLLKKENRRLLSHGTSNRTQGMREDEIRLITSALLQGLSYIHKQGFVHRDLKPENILCSKTGAYGPVKIADFSLATQYCTDERHSPIRAMTGYVATRWYRAPELLLLNSPITAAVPGGRLDTKGLQEMNRFAPSADMWSLGVIFAELLLGYPIFPGKTEEQQLRLIAQVLGTPPIPEEIFHEANKRIIKSFNKQLFGSSLKPPPRVPFRYRVQSLMKVLLPPTAPQPLQQLFPDTSPEAIQIVSDLLVYDPAIRPSASEIQRYEFFDRLRTEAHFMESKELLYNVQNQNMRFSLGFFRPLLPSDEVPYLNSQDLRDPCEDECYSNVMHEDSKPSVESKKLVGRYPNISFKFSLRP
ncbi:cyclin-dependent serine/threonine protein kinase [Galdieria sulphuraria]|uniref:Cyclin-dependent serine/threonine protein kinase n=1 Tax=Galdieria sulphuraria TaxID=130081 RepID=M2VSG0_GALSU|nr:cyclin-dependent serine/threonine protein kinase [Galdieria sulphuraria]EME26076.1 cyclin-dependent serine/threonine protein kinase [Galdieria sulphuraria]|eukprot:XP_005702596.1 cyclin-dependent serine/threonine protein kinase [Galdieria sulphuraria]